MMEFNKIFNAYTEKIQAHLHALLDDKEGEIYDAMRYSLYAGGKRIRPVITLACADALDGDFDAALDFGCALEMIHTYSLIHDDLPCMDNDSLRRGKPTNHIVFGEDMAVLAGDALLNLACETIANSTCCDALTKLTALKILFAASGTEGMIGGQVMDIKTNIVSTDEKTLTQLHAKKTGALIKAAAALGALCAQKDTDLFEGYASSLGLAFQIQDDILDVTGSEEKFGKPVMSDDKNNKVTYVTLYGIDGARNKLIEETESAVKALDFLEKKGMFLREFALYLLNREN